MRSMSLTWGMSMLSITNLVRLTEPPPANPTVKSWANVYTSEGMVRYDIQDRMG